jgi:hypothetical protein
MLVDKELKQLRIQRTQAQPAKLAPKRSNTEYSSKSLA